jgi:hypothetical protein
LGKIPFYKLIEMQKQHTEERKEIHRLFGEKYSFKKVRSKYRHSNKHNNFTRGTDNMIGQNKEHSYLMNSQSFLGVCETDSKARINVNIPEKILPKKHTPQRPQTSKKLKKELIIPPNNKPSQIMNVHPSSQKNLVIKAQNSRFIVKPAYDSSGKNQKKLKKKSSSPSSSSSSSSSN